MFLAFQRIDDALIDRLTLFTTLVRVISYHLMHKLDLNVSVIWESSNTETAPYVDITYSNKKLKNYICQTENWARFSTH